MQIRNLPITRFKYYCAVVVLGFATGGVVVAMSAPDAIGITALLGFFMALLWFAYRQPFAGLRKVLVVAFLLRAALALIHYYVVPLPDSGADAVTFERIGWELAQGWAAGAPFELITGAYLYSWVIGVLYFVVDRSPLLIQALNVFLGTLVVYITAAIARELFNSRVAVFAAWVACLFPWLLLYSAITMREVVTVFPFALAMLYFVRWLKVDRASLLLVSMVCLLASGLFHTGMIFLLVVPVAFWFYRTATAFLRLRAGSFVIKIVAGILLVGILTLPLVTGAGMEKLGDPTRLLDADYLGAKHEVQSRDRAAYLTGMKITSPVDLTSALPLKTIYFAFAPFPWQVNEPIDVVGTIDGLLYLGLVVLVWYGLGEVRSRHGKFVLWGFVAVLVAGVAIFAMGTGNYGTALRHRGKFAFMLIAVGGPVLQCLWFQSVGRIKVRKHLISQTRVVVDAREGA